jgi:anti-anti-sigma factor
MSAFPLPRSEAAEFSVTLTQSTGRARVSVRGELDLLTVTTFDAFLEIAMASARCSVVVDLAEVTFLNCSAVGQLAGALARVRRQGCDLAVVSPSPMAYRLLELRGFTELVEVERLLPTPRDEPVGQLVDDASAAALREVVDRAATTVGRADGASVTLNVRGNLATVAASDDVIAGMDADQYSLQEGPCVSAALSGEGFCIESMSSETRWPAFVARAYRRGINSVISTPLIVEGRPVGALNIYSRTSRAFALPQGQLAWQLATQVAAVLAAH